MGGDTSIVIIVVSFIVVSQIVFSSAKGGPVPVASLLGSRLLPIRQPLMGPM